MGLFRYDPARDLMRLPNFGRMMEGPFRAMKRGAGYWQPSVDVFERGNDIVLRADIPGVNPDDLDIRVNADSVTLKGAAQREEHTSDEGYYYSERQYGSFFRSIPLPAEVHPEGARASYRDGILELVMPRKTGTRETGHRVRIETGPLRDDQARTQ